MKSFVKYALLLCFVATLLLPDLAMGQRQIRQEQPQTTNQSPSIANTTGTFANELPPQTEFVFNLHRAVIKDRPESNVAVSPYGVQLILDLARTGAVGEGTLRNDKKRKRRHS